MKIGQKLLLFYGAALSVFVTFGAFALGLESGNWLAATLILPVLLHFALAIFVPSRRLRLLLYYSFILTTIMTVTGFIGAKSTPQLISAALFAPLALYFWQAVLPKRSHQIPVTALGFEVLQVVPESVPRLKKVSQEEKGGRGFDIDRRVFLKLIGSAGMTLFLFSIFTKRAEAAFFGSVPGPGTVALKDTSGIQINPAEKQPTDGYKINQFDDTSSATYSYYGFTNKDGDWFIMRETTSGANVGDYRYYKKQAGDDDFATEWPNRATLSPYDYFDVIF